MEYYHHRSTRFNSKRDLSHLILQGNLMMLANLAGVLCDGAKATCSLKAGTTALEAYLVALFALKGETSPVRA